MPSPYSPNDEFPALYRAVLDGVAEMERRGERSEAATIRRQAIAAYSAAWTERHRGVLFELGARTRRELERGPTDRRRLSIGHRHGVLARER